MKTEIKKSLDILTKPIQILTEPLKSRKKKIGLALGSGGAKGFAHIGVLKVLEREGIKIDMIAGSSMGAVIGALYGVHMNATALEKITTGFELKNYFDIGLPRSGLIKGDKLEKYLRKLLNNLKFKDLPFQLFVCATDLVSDKEIVFNEGDLTKAIRASISIPGLFYPVENKERILIDAGIKDPLPIDILKQNGCDFIIAVNLVKEEDRMPVYESATNVQSKKLKLPNILDISTKSEEMIEEEIVYFRKCKKKTDILIEPEVSSKDFFNFKKQKELIRAGEIAAEKKIRKIKRLAKKQRI
jgi:NTE family protein